jgi:hypothetical protein
MHCICDGWSRYFIYLFIIEVRTGKEEDRNAELSTIRSAML